MVSTFTCDKIHFSKLHFYFVTFFLEMLNVTSSILLLIRDDTEQQTHYMNDRQFEDFVTMNVNINKHLHLIIFIHHNHLYGLEETHRLKSRLNIYCILTYVACFVTEFVAGYCLLRQHVTSVYFYFKLHLRCKILCTFTAVNF